MRARISQSFRTWPDARAWLETLAVTTIFAVPALSLGLANGVLAFQRAPVPALPLTLRALVILGLLEELVFRVAPPPQVAGFALAAYVTMQPLSA